MNEVEPATLFASLFGAEFSDLLNTECLMIDEAICWIAFGTHDFPAEGPKILAEFLLRGDLNEYFDKQSEEHSLRFDIARRQLFSAAARGKVKIFGLANRPMKIPGHDVSKEGDAQQRGTVSVEIARQPG